MPNATTTYQSIRIAPSMPRLPLVGNIDLTYRCNHTCRHCWLWIHPNAPEKQEELTFDEIHSIADQARALGTREWNISGGEPMLRDDFPEIFDYLTRKTSLYSINTNGTRITPEIAQLLTRKGSKLIALYGATAETYDRVTRHEGGFEEAMRGFRYMQEAGANFTVQLIPMRDNWHEWDAMQELAKKLSSHWRVGAPWLYKTAAGNPARNAEIDRQRLSPRDVIDLDQPNPAYSEWVEEIKNDGCAGECSASPSSDGRVFAQCISVRREFHIDAYGKMTWCWFIKDPALRYDLRQGTFREAWDKFIPSCADKVHGGEEWNKNCGSCAKREDCRWCAAYAYLETGRYSARMPYLCSVADEALKFKADWQARHRRYFSIAGITVRVESALDFDTIKFKDKFSAFEAQGPGDDNVTLRHYFDLPSLSGKELGEELYHKAPWIVSRQTSGKWIYRGIAADDADQGINHVAVFSADHRHGTIYSARRDFEHIRRDGWHSLSLFPTDQTWLAQLLADRNAAMLQSAAVIINERGLLFIGMSEAKKNALTQLLQTMQSAGTGSASSQILCDSHNIARRWDNGWRVYRTWSHDHIEDVSSESAPLHAIYFIEKAEENTLTPLTDPKEISQRLQACIVKPLAIAAEWQDKTINLIEQMASEVQFYVMSLDTSAATIEDLQGLMTNRVNSKP